MFPRVESRRGKPLGAARLGQCPAGASISQTSPRTEPIGCGLLVLVSVTVQTVQTEQGACEGGVPGKVRAA